MIGAATIHFVNNNDATADKSRTSGSRLKYKLRNVSAKREFPQNCGRHAPRIHSQPVKDGPICASRESPKEYELVTPSVVEISKKGAVNSAKRTFPDGCGRDAPTSTAKLKMKAIVSANRTFPDGCGRNAPSFTTAKLKMKAVVSANRTFPNGCGWNAKMIQTNPEREGVLFVKQICPDVCEQNIQLGVSVGSADNMKSDSTCHETSPVEQSEVTRLLGVLNQVNTSDGNNHDNVVIDNMIALVPIRALDLMMVDTSKQLHMVSDQSPEPDPVKAVENNMRKKYPPQRRVSASRDIPMRCTVNASCSSEKVDSLIDIGISDEKVCGENIREVLDKSTPKKTTEIIDEFTHAKNVQENVLDVDCALIQSSCESISTQSDFESSPPCIRNLSCSVMDVISFKDTRVNDVNACEPNLEEVIARGDAQGTRESDKADHESRLQENVTWTAEIKDSEDCSNLAGAVHEEMVAHISVGEDFESRITEDRDCTIVRPCFENTLCFSGLTPSENVYGESGSSQENLVMESTRFPKEASLKRKFPRDSVSDTCIINKSHMQEYVHHHHHHHPTQCTKNMQEYFELENSREKKLISESPTGLSRRTTPCKRKKFVDDICIVNHPHIEESDGFALLNKRVIVHALIAAQNSPWNLMKHKSSSDSSDASAKRIKKNHEFVSRDQYKSISRREKAEGEKSELNTLKKRTSLTRNISYGGACDIILIDSDDSSSHNGVGGACDVILIEDDDSSSHNEEADSRLAQPSQNTNLSLIPFDLHKSAEKSAEDDAVVTCNEDKESLDLVETSCNMHLSLITSGSHPLVDENDGNNAGSTCNELKDIVSLAQTSHKLDLSMIPFGLHHLVYEDNGDEAGVTRKNVRETLRLFQGIYRKLLKDAESKSHGRQGNGPFRVDLMAAKVLKEKNKCVNTGNKFLGHVPGVEVGDEFHYRVELAIIGLHGPYQGGIDYLNRSGKMLATSVVASGVYADVMDSSDVLVYSGQGGIPIGKNKKPEDQKLERGNLSLKNSFDERSPVRVIRGYKETKGIDLSDLRGKIVATYVYDGLYFVEKYWQETGIYGTKVFKFELRRIPGQPELPMKEVKKSKRSKVREGLCVDDISQGKEENPIRAINTLDDEKPPPFEYITNMIYPSSHNLVPHEGCQCTDGCSDSKRCACAMKNGGEIPFNYDGAIVEARPLVYECGPSCKCSSSCHNRVSQHGIKFQLEIFKTDSRGWGVRSLNSIPSGSFICEYTGELLEDTEAERRTGNDEYLFDIGQNYSDLAKNIGENGPSSLDETSMPASESVEEIGYTIDAATCGSVGRFVNHSCSPNLYAQNVLFDHHDKSMPHIMLFAAENIPPLQELTYHYNYELDQVRDSDGNIKKKNCYCGSDECTGRLY